MQKARVIFRGRTQSGATLIEVLVTLLIMSLALMGAAGMQAAAMRLNQGGTFRTQAVFMAADLAERMEANKSGAINGDYVVPASGIPSTAGLSCVSSPCSSKSLADFDKSQWEALVSATLPQSTWEVTQTVAGNPSIYTINISWVDRRATENNANNTSGTTYASADSTSKVGANAAGNGEKFSYSATRTVFR